MPHPSSAASRPDSESGGNVASLFGWHDLERLKAAADTILEHAPLESDPDTLESELTSFKERLERVLLHLGQDR